MSTLDRWIFDALDQGAALTGHCDWPSDRLVVPCTFAGEEFDRYRRKGRGGSWAPVDARTIGERLREVFGCEPSASRRVNGSKCRTWELPGLAEARQQAAKAFGLPHHQWGQS